MIQGPNVKKLIIAKMSRDAIPDGGGFGDGIAFLLSGPERLMAAAKASTDWVERAIQAVRMATGPNPWKDADDETIAAEILRSIAERKQK